MDDAYSLTTLDGSTWDQFADLVERNGGIFGGCWCLGFHLGPGDRTTDRRGAKEERVRSGNAHAALVIDGEGAAQGWAQWGSKAELPGIKHLRAYRQEPPEAPDWRITCVFVDKRHRGEGVARLAVEGALAQIAAQGGGRVEAISETTADRVAHGRFLFSGTVELLESLGFERVRQVGKHAWIMARVLDPA